MSSTEQAIRKTLHIPQEYAEAIKRMSPLELGQLVMIGYAQVLADEQRRAAELQQTEELAKQYSLPMRMMAEMALPGAIA